MQKPAIGDTLHGFTVQEIRDLPEIKAAMYRMEYTQNGAKLIWLDRSDECKSFAIAFPTIPQDNTGVFHILEHAVLCGSQKYPVKEPYKKLQRSSFSAYVNAFTYADKTVYTACSRNGKEFQNLMDVMLDAVFHPLCVEEPYAFQQEGWHYEADPESGALRYNGVVLNEMRGGYEDTDTILGRVFNRALLPDTCYVFDSGGDPACIPDLTFQHLCDAHAKYYQPSNAYIVLDGTLDLDAALAQLDGYLASYPQVSLDCAIPMQSPVSPPEIVLPYDASEQEDLPDQAVIARGWVCGTFAEREKEAAFQILLDVLEEPLRRAIVGQGLAQELAVFQIGGLQQTFMGIQINYVRPEDRDRIWAIADAVLQEQADGGLDREDLEAQLNLIDFRSRENEEDEMDGGNGLDDVSSILNSWLYGGDPAQHLQWDHLFHTLRARIDTGWYEDLIREVLLHNPHQAKICLLPSDTLLAEHQAIEQARLDAIQTGWDAEQARQVASACEAFQAWQAQPDDRESLAKLPRLTLEDIPRKPEPIPGTIETLDGFPVLRELVHTNGVRNIRLYFDTADLPPETLVKLPLLSKLLRNLPTEKYTEDQLTKTILGKLGGFCVISICYAGQKRDTARPVVWASATFLDGQEDTVRDLFREVLQTSRFTEKDRVRDIVRQMRLETERLATIAGAGAAEWKAITCFSANAVVMDMMYGIEQLRWLQQMDQNFDRDGDALCAELESLCKTIFTRARLTPSASAVVSDDVLRAILSDLPAGTTMGEPHHYDPLAPAALGIQLPAQVGYCALCAVAKPFGGAGMVATRILSQGYLWDEVRVKGGAYSVHGSLSVGGTIRFTSAFDPHCSRTLEIFQHAGAALRAFCNSGESLEPYIISAAGSLDKSSAPSKVNAEMATAYFSSGKLKEDSKTLEEVLQTTREDLLAISDTLDDVLRHPSVCVVGGEETLQACGAWLNTIEPLFL